MSTIDSFFQRGIDRYYEEVERGEHDPQCERRERMHMCHCSKRKRIASGLTEPPELWYQEPVCANCLKEVYHDGDGWRCDNCATSWGSSDFDQPGTFIDDYGDLTDERSRRMGDLLLTKVDHP